MEEFSTCNYKGVMLCSRPSYDSLSPYTTSSHPTHKPAFKSGVSSTHTTIGLQPSNTYKLYINKKFRRDKTNNITYKHKQWLKKYSQTQQLTQSQQLNKTTKAVNVQKSSDIIHKYTQNQQHENNEQKTHSDKDNDPADKENLNSSGTVHITDVPCSTTRPLWAMTDEQAEQAEEEEADQLLQYTENLDFKSYINDIEVNNALKFVRDRIQQLEHQQADFIKQHKKQYQQSSYDKSINMNEYNMFADNDDNTRYNTITDQLNAERAKQHELESKLNTIDSTVTNPLRDIHSSASIRALIEQTKSATDTNTTSTTQPLPPINESCDTILPSTFTPQPIIAIHNTKSAVASKKTTVDPSNLPYLYRHPGI